MGLNSGRRGLHDHGLAQVIVRDGVGHDDDAIGVGHLGPRGCHLTVEQTGIDTGEHELDVAVAEDRALGDGTLMGGRRRDCRGLGLHRLERLRLDANAGAGLGNDVLGDIVGRLGCVEASGVHLDEHRQVHAGQDRPTGMGVEQTADLVEGRAAPQIDEEQDVLGIVEGSDRLFHLLAEVVRTHARHEGNRGDVGLIAEDHRTGHLQTLCQVTMACQNDTYHHTTSSVDTRFEHNFCYGMPLVRNIQPFVEQGK